MRAVTAGLFHSVDGVVEAPDQWQFDSFDDELGQSMGGFMSRTTTAVMGRVAYESWSDHFGNAGADDPFAGFINPVEKFVASRTLTGDLAWQNSTLIDGDPVEFVRRLKQADGGDIALVGGVSLVRQLFLAGVLDTLTLMTHPVVVGKGQHLFEPGDPLTRLVLTNSLVTSRGNVVVDYAVKGD
ncbi:dihydrofolate reductase family protein [Rhodococcus sp. BP-241]|nr:dihydrofolate reductase family protein [Rhodococcus sp. BP-241]